MNLDQNSWTESIEKSKKSVVLDVRTPEEYDEGFIPNAININIYDSQFFIDEVNKLNKKDFIHVYCRSGSRSFQACEIIKQFGFENVYNLEGGIIEWQGKIINSE
jgi:rhodanese-related sulfurtransferase